MASFFATTTAALARRRTLAARLPYRSMSTQLEETNLTSALIGENSSNLRGQIADLKRRLGLAEHRESLLQAPPVINWSKVGFGITPVNGHMKYTWKPATGWDKGVFQRQPTIDLHIHAGVVHYGVSCFEGLKAFHCKDGSHRIMNAPANYERMATSARRLVMPEVPLVMFEEAVHAAVAKNLHFVPPYGTGGSMYIRPFLFASGAILGLQPAQEYTFIVNVMPVGNYFGAGPVKGIKALVMDDFDRAAPGGTGNVKAAGNYAADLLPLEICKKSGHQTTLYLDAKEKKYIEEFSVSNLIAITRDGKYVTPKTSSVLPSITNKMLMMLARDMGIVVEERAVEFEAEIDSFVEVAGSGTAVVLAPIESIRKGDKVYQFQPFNVLQKIYQRFRDIQTGDAEDTFHWMRRVDASLVHKEFPAHDAVVTAASTMLQGVGHHRGPHTVEELEKFYDELATHYDTVMTELCTGDSANTPAVQTFEMLSKYVPIEEQEMLDAGAGTGYVGPLLRSAGVGCLTAMDLSEGMLKQAKRREAYTHLVKAALPNTPFSDSSFDAIYCSGTIAPNQTPAVSHAEFCRITRPGGHVVFNIPHTILQGPDGAAHMAAMEVLERMNNWRLVAREERPYLPANGVEASYFVYQKCIMD